ncbi:hypothetical protein [Alkalicoccobacillus porphyridii]|uniref:Uncharacterized protein n=1 Tax=Alkalicoccobacillus porphyridii TaxID=2597270 RepID=A0A553ZWW0_9BACI|nr:hypothetical protein [Alkalicoccobacillus porphyridii]TSB45923.1 hypothetical protein FN960_13500 [Alkalicoccobacillus porphyridii]
MKMKSSLFTVFMLICFILVGCLGGTENNTVSNTEENMTAEEFLTQNPESDMFMFYGIIHNTNVDWVDELTLTKGEQVGEIKEQVAEGNYDYANGTANKLPVGTIIYEAKERDDILIVEVNGEEKYYYALVEG